MKTPAQHSDPRPCRCVVLHHHRRGGDHYDLMIERPAGPIPSKLATWQVAVHPRHWGHVAMLRLIPLGDHRADYLDYEGPLSDSRGWVRRADRGTARWLIATPTRFLIDLRLGQFNGRILSIADSTTQLRARLL